jgi:hypothetical protein
VAGLYLEPPQNAVVVCVDEKSQIQALDRARPDLPMRPGIPGRQTHDCIRHGTTTLSAALETAAGRVTDACYPRRRHGEFLKFLNKVAAAHPGQELHVVCDNYATHKHADVRKWLRRPENQRAHLTAVAESIQGKRRWPQHQSRPLPSAKPRRCVPGQPTAPPVVGVAVGPADKPLPPQAPDQLQTIPAIQKALVPVEQRAWRSLRPARAAISELDMPRPTTLCRVSSSSAWPETTSG